MREDQAQRTSAAARLGQLLTDDSTAIAGSGGPGFTPGAVLAGMGG